MPSEATKVKRMTTVEHSGNFRSARLRSSKLEVLADCSNMPDPSSNGSAAHPNEQKLPPFLRTLDTLLKWVPKAPQYGEKAWLP